MKQNLDKTDQRKTSGVLLTGHFNEDETYLTKRAEGMKDWLLTFTLSGEGYFQFQNERFICRSGDIAILKTGVPHKYGTNPGHRWNFLWAHFIPSAQEMGLLQLQEMHKGFIQHNMDTPLLRKRLHRAFLRMNLDSRQVGPYWEELASNALHEILLLLSQTMATSLDPRIEQTLRLINERMNEPLQISELAAAVQLSPSRLSHLFKEETGDSIIEVVIRMRLRQAALLLEHTYRSAAEIALDIGFQNYNHFFNQFKSSYGVSPAEYRKQLRD